MLGAPVVGQPMMGGTPWSTKPPALVFGGMVPPPLMGGGTPTFSGIMGQVMPQFGAASQFGLGVALGSPAFWPPVFLGVGWGGAFPHPSG